MCTFRAGVIMDFMTAGPRESYFGAINKLPGGIGIGGNEG